MLPGSAKRLRDPAMPLSNTVRTPTAKHCLGNVVSLCPGIYIYIWPQHETPNMFFQPTCRIMEEKSGKKNHGGGIMEQDFWEAFGKHLGRWDEMRWNEMRWKKMKWDEMKWDEMIWNEMKWNEMKWNEMIWNEMKWNEMIWDEMEWDEMRWDEMKLNEMSWNEMR